MTGNGEILRALKKKVSSNNAAEIEERANGETESRSGKTQICIPSFQETRKDQNTDQNSTFPPLTPALS